MKVTRVERLGAVVAYKNNEVQVLDGTYSKVPEEFQPDFETVLETAYNKYKEEVNNAKSAGQKPASAKIKKDTIENIINPFLAKYNIAKEKVERVVKPTNPDIPRVKKRESLIVDEDLDINEADFALFENYDSETLSDDVSIEIETPSITDDVEIDDIFSGVSDFDFEALLD